MGLDLPGIALAWTIGFLDYDTFMPWGVRAIRFSSFLMANASAPSDAWAVVIGGVPENSAYQRAVGIRQETGSFLDATATPTVQPGRMDWNFTPSEILPHPGAATLGDFPGATDRYLEPVSRWIRSQQFPSVKRFALGLDLTEPTDTRESGYARLRHFVDAVPQGDVTDFSYQVNRPRPSGIGISELRINRLAQWSVSQLLRLSLTAGSSPEITSPLSLVSLSLDVNTSAEFVGPIPRDVLGPLLEDLKAGAIEIAEHGDRV